MKVLVIDDSATMRTMIRRVVETALDATVYESPESQDGIQTIAADEFDLVICDGEMADRDDGSFVETIRRDGYENAILIIGEGDLNRLRAEYAGQVEGFLAKSFEIDELEAEVRRLVPACQE